MLKVDNIILLWRFVVPNRYVSKEAWTHNLSATTIEQELHENSRSRQHTNILVQTEKGNLNFPV